MSASRARRYPFSVRASRTRRLFSRPSAQRKSGILMSLAKTGMEPANAGAGISADTGQSGTRSAPTAPGNIRNQSIKPGFGDASCPLSLSLPLWHF
jgi:hypothetical protein